MSAAFLLAGLKDAESALYAALKNAHRADPEDVERLRADIEAQIEAITSRLDGICQATERLAKHKEAA